MRGKEHRRWRRFWWRNASRNHPRSIRSRVTTRTSASPSGPSCSAATRGSGARWRAPSASSRHSPTSRSSPPTVPAPSPPAGSWRRRTSTGSPASSWTRSDRRRPWTPSYFSLHGAMEAESEHDPEGFLLAETRKILGERMPIVVSLDLHGILTDRMLQHADAVVVYHTYPHVDFFQTGERAARLLLRILAGDVRPVTAAVTDPGAGSRQRTDHGDRPVRHRSSARPRPSRTSPGGLSAGMFIGNPFTDVPDLCSNERRGDRRRPGAGRARGPAPRGGDSGRSASSCSSR